MNELISKNEVMKIINFAEYHELISSSVGKVLTDSINNLDTVSEYQDKTNIIDKIIDHLEKKCDEYKHRLDIRKGYCFYDETASTRKLNERLYGVEQAIKIVKYVCESDIKND